jgi:hypothetical protein
MHAVLYVCNDISNAACKVWVSNLCWDNGSGGRGKPPTLPVMQGVRHTRSVAWLLTFQHPFPPTQKPARRQASTELALQLQVQFQLSNLFSDHLRLRQLPFFLTTRVVLSDPPHYLFYLTASLKSSCCS